MVERDEIILRAGSTQQASQEMANHSKKNIKLNTPWPKPYTLGPEHVSGGKILANREMLLRELPHRAITAEIGVDQGDFSAKIMQFTKPSKLHLIDTWDTVRYNDIKARAVSSRFIKEINECKIVINRVKSIDAANQFPDGYFDWVYLDTTHSYIDTIKELYAYSEKIKTNGYIAGHDYTMGNWRKSLKYGVIEAVAEFCVKERWKLIYWTADFTEGNSFAIKRINDRR